MAEENKAPDSKILIDGSELEADTKSNLRETTIDLRVDAPGYFEISFNLVSGQNQDMQLLEQFELGSSVEIQMGYLDAYQSLFVGEITALQPKFTSSGTALLQVQGYDKLHRLGRGKKSRIFSEMSDSQIANQILEENELSSRVDDSEIIHPYVLQNNLSDLHFLQSRARRIGFEIKVDGEDIAFIKKGYHLSGEEELEYPHSLKWFFPRMSSIGAVGKVEVLGWNPETKEQVVGVAQSDSLAGAMGSAFGLDQMDSAFGERTYVESEVPVYSQNEANQLALGHLQKFALEWIKGEGECVGNPNLKAGQVVAINGLGGMFSGDYYLDRVEHSIGPELGYITGFHGIRNAS